MNQSVYLKTLLKHFLDEAERSAFAVYDGKELRNISCREFANSVLCAASNLKKRGIQKKQIALLGENSYEWIVAYYAIILSGNTALPLNGNLPETNLRDMQKKADVEFVWCDDEFSNVAAVAFGNAERISYTEMSIANAVNDLEEIWSIPESPVVCMLPTSGTTGKSKIAMLSMENLYYGLKYMNQSCVKEDIRSYYLILPLHHIGGIITMMSMLDAGVKICIGRGAKYLFMDIPVFQPNLAIMVPSMAETLVKMLKRMPQKEEEKKESKYFHTIAFVGAPMKKETGRYLLEHGFRLESFYGMTETAGTVTHCEHNADNIQSIGKPQGNWQCRIEDGELLLKGPAVFEGYYKEEAATADFMEDGWLQTGDMVRCDEEGNYYLVGRKKNIIILSNGENVNSEEIEEQLYRCEEILECVVYCDETKICAKIFTKNQEIAEAFVENYNDEVPLYRHIYKVEYSAKPLEKTASGKLKRK